MTTARRIRVSLAAVLALVGFLTLVASSGVKEAKRGAESRRAGLVKLIHTRQGEVESLGKELVRLRADVVTARRRLSATSADEARRLRDVQMWAGTTPMSGPGLEVRLSDGRPAGQGGIVGPGVAVGPRRRSAAGGQRLVGGRGRGGGRQRAAARGDIADPGGGGDDHRELPAAGAALQGRGDRRRQEAVRALGGGGALPASGSRTTASGSRSRGSRRSWFPPTPARSSCRRPVPTDPAPAPPPPSPGGR